jgi:hypothetical protein
VDESKSSAEGRTDHPEVCAGDPFFAAGRRTHGECVEAMRQEEARLGRKMIRPQDDGPGARGIRAGLPRP